MLPLQFSPFALENECKSEQKSSKKEEKTWYFTQPHTHKWDRKRIIKSSLQQIPAQFSGVRLETVGEGFWMEPPLKGDQTPHETLVLHFSTHSGGQHFYFSYFLLLFSPAMRVCLTFSCLILALFHSFSPCNLLVPPNYLYSFLYFFFVLEHFPRCFTLGHLFVGFYELSWRFSDACLI